MRLNYEKLRERYGDEGVAAAEELTAMYLPETYEWLASLWDGSVGAFYYATSARVNDGFLPDSESTQQAIGLLRLLGLFPDELQLPASMREKLGRFAYSLQDPDGYFYHPQWKEMMLNDPERYNSRRGRDFGQCMWLLNTVSGIKPKYPTALDNLKKAACGMDTGNATIPEYLRSREAFIKPLDEMDINTSSYPKGHWISSQASQIIAAGLAETCIEYMTEKQNKENGTWESEVNQRSIDGVTKIGTAFCSLGARIPNATVAFRSAVSVALKREPTTAVTNAYNPFWTMEQMLNGFKSGGMDEEYLECKRILLENGVELMRVTAEKLRPYYHAPEAAFHYCTFGSSPTSQRVPTSLGVKEGDVNATSLGIDTIVRIFRLLDADIGKPCGAQDGEAFLRLIGEL